MTNTLIQWLYMIWLWLSWYRHFLKLSVAQIFLCGADPTVQYGATIHVLPRATHTETICRCVCVFTLNERALTKQSAFIRDVRLEGVRYWGLHFIPVDSDTDIYYLLESVLHLVRCCEGAVHLFKERPKLLLYFSVVFPMDFFFVLLSKYLWTQP